MAKILESFKRIRKVVFLGWAICLACILGVCQLAHISYLWAIAFAIFPVVLLLSTALIICLFTLIGDGIKAKNPPSCENCIWNKARNITGFCMGEKMGYTYGKVCSEYQREE